MAFPWIFQAVVFGIIALDLGINGSSSLISYKQTTVDPTLQTSIKPPSTIVSTKTDLHTHQVTEHHASDVSVALNSSVARIVQVSHGSTQGSHWSTDTTYQQEPTPLIEASTNVNAAHTDQKTETGLRSVSMTNKRSSIATLQISTATEEALVATHDNSIAHITLTAISKKRDTSIQQISLPLSTQTRSLLATSKSKSANPITVSFSSVSVSLLRSSSLGHELFSRTSSLSTSRNDISAMTSTTKTSEMVISNSTYEVAAKTSREPQNSLTTMTLGSLTKTIYPSSVHTKGSKESFSVTPMVGQRSTFLLPSSGNGSFDVSSLPSFKKGTESLQTYPRRVTSSTSATTSIPKAEFNASYNMAAATETLILAHTLKLSNNFSRMSLPTSRGNTTTSLAQSITPLIHTINSSAGVLSVIHPTRSSVAAFSTIFWSLLPPSSFTPTITQSVTKTSLISKIYQTTGVLSPVNATLPSSSNITATMSSLPDILNKTSELEVIPSLDMLLTTDVFSEVHATRVSTSAVSSFKTFTPKSILAGGKTSRKRFPSSNALANRLTSIYQTETSGSPTLSMESPSRMIKDSTSESSVKDASQKLTRTQHLSATRTPAFSSLIKEATVRINTSNIRTVILSLDSSLDTFASETISIITSTMVQTSDGVSMPPFNPSLTAESFLSVKASNTTSTSLTTSTAGSGSRLQSPTLAHASPSLLFLVSPGASETSVLVLTTQKPSKGVSVTMQDKSSTLASVIIVPSPSTEGNFSSAAGLPSTSNTTQQRTYSALPLSRTSLVDTLPWRTFTMQNTYVYVDSIASPNQTPSSANVSLYSSHRSLQLVSTFETIISKLSRTTHQLSTTALPHSTHVLTSKSVNLTRGLTFVPSSMHSNLVGYVTQTRATSTTKTSASSRNGDITEVNTVESVFAISSHAIKSTAFGSVSTNTLRGNSIGTSFSKTKETLDRIQTQSSPSQETSPFTRRTTSSIGLNTTKTFGTATTALEATVSVSTQTKPPPGSPKQFDVSMVLQMTWESHYEHSYTQEFQALASKVKTQVTRELITLDGFLSLNVLRFWKSSVGVDLVVFVKKSAEVSEDTVERKVIEANNTGVLDLPLTSIQVQERGTIITTTLPATQSTNEDKSIERWVIILIVAGILVLSMTLIICCLVVKIVSWLVCYIKKMKDDAEVKLTKQSGGLRRSSKYQVSGANSYLNYLYTDLTEPGAKPVILRMEERRTDLKDDSSAASAYDSSSREESMSRKNDRLPSNDYSNSDYEWITTDSATSSTVISSTERRTKEVKDTINVTPYTTAGRESVQRLSPNEDRMSPSAHNSNPEYRHSSEDSITPGIVTSQLHRGFGNKSNVATTSSCNRSEDGGNKHAKVSTDEEWVHQNYGYNDEEKF